MEQVLAGRYVLGAELGAGGMARVVRARDTALDRDVAVKLLPTGVVDPAARERFRREARWSAAFTHPNAVAVFDAGEDHGQLFLVMELVDGPSLAHVLATRGRLPVDQALHVADGVLAALDAAHRAGIVHRDIKPGNVLLGPGGQVKLADFGIARRLDDLAHDLTAAHTVLGTLRYTAPEQLAGMPASAASDVYAVGVVLFEALAGFPPYADAAPAVIAAAHQLAPVPDLAAARRDVPPAVAAAVGRALAKDPTARFPTAGAMRAALAQRTTAYPLRPPLAAVATSVSPVAATPPPHVAAVHRPSQRWWWVVTGAVLLAGAGGLAWALRDPGAGALSPSSTAAGATTVPATAPVPTPTTVPPPTEPPTTTAAPTTAAPTTEPRPDVTVDDVVTAVFLDPTLFGFHTFDVISTLTSLNGRGADDARRAGDLLEDLDGWVADGSVDDEAADMLRAALGPIAER